MENAAVSAPNPQHTPEPRLTAKKKVALGAAFKQGGAWYGLRGSRAGGSYSRMCRQLAAIGLVERGSPYPITLRGMEVLRGIWDARWRRDGCYAYLLDLEAVDAAIAKARGEQ
ncbi:hypothetical protein OMP43_21725 [Sphingomonas sp. CBMAI 2297]|uniref:hypothetical protein n=1 Tax=Sphingomonas sp. CBMAI 2297 TaxID=2991720 RepID=UPI00245386CF|nr:hypothetical protein [Sphingomonas sp. CBMAI 2297]MDH4746650.1 hypothetical protein [Sphingomonas sp. CBMAI 2297]